MDTNNESSVNIKETENDINAPQEVNDNIPCDTNTEIKDEPSETLENILDELAANIEEALPNEEPTEILSETLPSEISKSVPETVLGSIQSDDKEQSSSINVAVKQEPCNEEIDYGMPIAKTPMHKSFSESREPLDNINENQAVFTNKALLDKFTSRAALDEYLDGMATPLAPVAPRLRVKSELALLKPPQPEEMQGNNEQIRRGAEAANTEMCAPPPPALSSNSNSDFVADGVATPRLSLASINRLRVKSEFSLPQSIREHNEVGEPSEAGFNDLINAKNSEREDGEVSPNATDEASDNEEMIPDDYFDDLLIDKLKEKIDATQNNDLEVKYSDRLKELERLRTELSRIEEKKARKIRKKQKKAKKKSRKRSRSRSMSPHSKAKERNFVDLPNTDYDRSNKRSRMPTSRQEQPTSSKYISRPESEEAVLRVDSGYINIKTEYSANELDSFTRESLLNIVEEVEDISTPTQRKQRAIKRATALLDYLRSKSEDNSGILFEFPFVSTVRKLPTRHSYVQQQNYENRSPLHRVNNVNYKFNSHSSNFKMEDWGLASLPPIAAKLAKQVGCNAEFIHNKLKTIKIPAKVNKVKQEPNEQAEHTEEEELVETSSSLYSNAMTQTDDLDEFVRQGKEKGYEIGIQATPEAYSIGSQTLETQSPAETNLHNKDELPLMKLIQNLNENQLMAIHSFAELIKEQNTSTSNAMEMYKIQMQIMDIYKMSQIPSAFESAQPAIVNNYTPTKAARPHEQTNLCIKSVEGADGRQFTVNDIRGKSGVYSQRTAYGNVGPPSAAKYDPRYAVRPSTSKGYYSQTYFSAISEHDDRYASTSRHHPYIAHSSHSPPTAAKRYGRGGLRR